jgi:hypothetical protein
MENASSATPVDCIVICGSGQKLIEQVKAGEWSKAGDAFIEWINETAPSESRAATRIRQAIQGMLYELEVEKKALSDIRQITSESLNAERRLSK